MNLIEQLGGYEKAKRELELKEKNSIFQCCSAVDAGTIRDALLQYRREHNIFEVGDKVVFDSSKAFCRLLPSDLMIFNGSFDTDARVIFGGKFYAVSLVALKHATDEEIKANKRLEVH